MAEKTCIRIPSDEALEEQSGWTALGDGTYSAIRFHLLVVRRREPNIVKGPAIKVLNLPGGSEYKIERKNARVVKHAETIEESIQETVTVKLAQEVTQKIASEIGVAGVLPSAKLSNEVQLKSGAELTDAVQRGLTHTRSYEVQDSEEITRSVSFKSDGTSRPPLSLHFYLGLWPWKWDFYLLKAEYLRLKYAKHWYWRDVRKTISQTLAEPKVPLFRASFYEPQDEFSIDEGSHSAEVADDGDEIAIESLAASVGKGSCPAGDSLEELAKRAFPVTRKEKKLKKQKALKIKAKKKAAHRHAFASRGRVAAGRAFARSQAAMKKKASSARKSKAGARKKATKKRAKKRG